MKHQDLPSDFSYAAYRDLNSDLAPFSDAELATHYLTHGIHEGRLYQKILHDFTFEPPMSGGVNVLAFMNNIMGLAATGRMIAKSVQNAGIPCNINQFPIDEKMHSFMETTKDCQYGVNIVCINPDIGYARIDPRFFNNRKNIALIFWELEKLPANWIDSLRAFDEIWVGSSFNEAILRHLPEKEIVCLPLKAQGIEIMEKNACKQAFDIDPETFVCMFTFDGRSDLQRKNPQAVIKAFRMAFGSGENARLVIKTHHCSETEVELMITATGNDSRISIWNEEVPESMYNALLNACDLYISLHRSEGLGLTMMEALLLGKPVICTAYSGNLDFCHEDWSEHVNYELIEVSPHSLYARIAEAGNVWAEPDAVHAASKIREVYASYDAHLAKAATGKKWIEEMYSSEKLDKIISSRLEKYLTAVIKN